MPGGVEQVIIGLASGLSTLTDGLEEYLFLTYAGADEWIRPYLRGPCRILTGPAAPRQPMWKQWVGSTLPAVRDAWHRLGLLRRWRCVSLRRSDGTIEKNNIHIMHFTKQSAFFTDVPSIYHPHDLQHLHLPQLFSQEARIAREVRYRRFCEQARMVAVTSTWVKRDLIRHYGLPESKVQVVPWASVLSAYPSPSPEDLAAARQKFCLRDPFIFYCAQTWAHKNHIGLLEALATLGERCGVTVRLVCCGRLTDFFPKIERRTRELGLSDQVQFLGFVSPLELQCLYKLCRCLCNPTKFGAASFPLWEAFEAGVPVACSNVTSLPEQAGDAALIFDPNRPDQIAEAIRRLWTDEKLRRTLVERGKRRVSRFTWDRTARMFRAHYRRLANRPLTEEDRSLLASPPLL